MRPYRARSAQSVTSTTRKTRVSRAGGERITRRARLFLLNVSTLTEFVAAATKMVRCILIDMGDYRRPLKYEGFTRTSVGLTAFGLMIQDIAHGIEQWKYLREMERTLVNQRKVRPEQWLRSLKSLEKRGFMKKRVIGERVVWYLTDDGERELRVRRIALIKKSLRGGAVCLVVFDFPEQESVARDLFRRFLKDCGFVMLQGSVWYHKRSVLKPVKKFIQEMKLDPLVRIFEAFPYETSLQKAEKPI